MTLRERLLKALEFKRELFRFHFDNIMSCPEVDFDEVAAYHANTKNEKIYLALADVVEALEDLKNDIECRGDAYWLVCRTIAKLDEALKGLGK